MSLFDSLQQILAAGASDPHQVEAAARQAPKADLGAGLADAFRSDQTPPFGDMVGQLFANASPEQRSAMLNAIVEKLGPGALAGVAGGALAGHEGADTPAISPTQASQLSPDQVRDVTVAAHRAEPGLLDRMGSFYAEHPDLIKTLGAGAVMIALARLKNNIGR
ncbi:hypothetical protein [Ottowia sp.]|uniref:hypothetical protein n=1 Tax=Ottowia sp. TaxID=1898956 RepID=UPI0039E24BB9